MWRNTVVAVAIVAVSAAAALWVSSGPTFENGPEEGRDGPTASARTAALRSFGACDELTDWLARKAEPHIGPWGPQGAVSPPGLAILENTAVSGVATDAAAAPAPMSAGRAAAEPTYSGTNVQEVGVDEPDVVKTDGRRLFTVRDGRLLHVDLTGAEPQLVSSTPVGAEQPGPGEADLLLSGDRLLVVWRSWDVAIQGVPAPRGDATLGLRAPGTAGTRAHLFDVSADEPQLLESARFDGELVSGRLHGDTARLVLRNAPVRLPQVQPRTTEPADLEAATRANVAAVRAARASDWLPWMSVTDETGPSPVTSQRPITRCEDVHHSGEFAGFGTLDVLTVQLGGSLEDVDATSVLTGADTVYASNDHLVVTTYRWPQPQPVPLTDVPVAPGGPVPTPATAPAPEDFTTAVHAFDLTDPSRTRYVGSGEVPGHVLNQFSLSEHDGHLRVATTVGAPWAGGSESGVHVLRFDDGRLTRVGQIGDLGRGERIYAVRFAGDVGYVVTFREVDPLYTLDLSDPTDPELLGELKIPGYSAYLHPVGGDHLLGIGQDATEQGRTLGTQVSLFDVSDLSRPRQVAKTVISDAQSEAEFDHHAFLFWPGTGLTVVPVSRWSGASPWSGALAFEVDGDRLDRVGELSHAVHVLDRGAEPWESVELGRISRSIVVGDRLLTVSRAGLLTSDLDTLEDRAWLPLGSR